MNERLPTLNSSEATALPPGTRLVLLLPDAQHVDRARESLRLHGLDAAPVNQQDFGEGSDAMSVVIANLVRLSFNRPGT